MRIVPDTNILIASFLSHGVCAELLEYIVTQYQLITSPFILKEFRDTLVRKFKLSTHQALQAQRLLSIRMEIVTPSILKFKVCRDKDDDYVIGTAIAGQCHCIITGDKDLLSLKKFQGIDIISPSDFWKYEKD